MGSPRLASRTLNPENNYPQYKILALPIELNPMAIEHCLGYIHGNPIKLNKPEASNLEILSKIYIVAEYLEISSLANRINLLHNIYSDKSLDFPGMNAFVRSLPKPSLLSIIPEDLTELP